jgi:cob(I)alamin adenosyltransferase
LIELNESEGGVNPHALKFVNRLSDYLFTLARWTNLRAGKAEEQWIGKEFL